jgi:hypothetical protein
VGKLAEKVRSRINFYIQKYLETKGIADASWYLYSVDYCMTKLCENKT